MGNEAEKVKKSELEDFSKTATVQQFPVRATSEDAVYFVHVGMGVPPYPLDHLAREPLPLQAWHPAGAEHILIRSCGQNIETTKGLPHNCVKVWEACTHSAEKVCNSSL